MVLLNMSKIRRGNFVFLNWTGDHGNHVHVYRNGKLLVKYDLKEQKIMKGKLSNRVLKIINDLEQEGFL